MTELKTAKDLQNRHEDLRERLLAKLCADAFAIHHDEIVRSPQTEMDYIERIDRAETALAAAKERIAELQNRYEEHQESPALAHHSDAQAEINKLRGIVRDYRKEHHADCACWRCLKADEDEALHD